MLIKVALANNYSEEAIFAGYMTTWAAKNNKLDASFSQATLDQINCYRITDMLELAWEQGKQYMTKMWLKAAILKRDNPEWTKDRVFFEANLEAIQIGLDIIGFIPVGGEAADLANGVIYLMKGDPTNATLSFAATVPFAGWAATGTKYAVKIVENANTGQKILKVIAEGADEIAELSIKAAERVSQGTINKISTAVEPDVTAKIINDVSSTKVFAETVEEAAEEIIDTAQKQNKKLSWEEVKALFKRGNDFNAKAVTDGWYDFHEVYLANGKRLDSYDPDLGEIVSRKATDLSNIKFSTFENYLKEMQQKYPAGTQIRSNKYPELDGKFLQGQQILEIPVSNQSVPNFQMFYNFAKNNYNIKIRFRPE